MEAGIIALGLLLVVAAMALGIRRGYQKARDFDKPLPIVKRTPVHSWRGQAYFEPRYPRGVECMQTSSCAFFADAIIDTSFVNE